MRVVVVVPWEPWRTSDGAVLPVHQHLHALNGRHELVVLAAGGPTTGEVRVTGPARKLPDGLDVRWFGTDRSAAADYALRRLCSEWVREPAHVLWAQRPALVAALREEARTADLVHLAGWGTAQLAGHVDRPAVHFAIDPWAASWHNRTLPRWRRLTDAGQRRLVEQHESRWYPRCSSVAVVAQADVALLERTAPGGRYAVVPNGVEPGPEPVPCAAPVLGFHGAFETQANVDGARALVLEVLPRVQARLPAARVLLVGRDPGPEVLELAARPGVELRSDVPSVRSELDRTAVHVSWMPSGLGLKNKVLEALAAGRPAVTNERGASGIGAGPGLTVAADLDQAAAAVVRLLSDPDLLARESRAARERVVRDWSWAGSARALERLWEQAVG